MSAYFDIQKISEIKNYRLVIDTNILTSCSANETYLAQFLNIFKHNTLLIDPIVKLEFLRGTYGSLFQKKNIVLNSDRFEEMVDSYELYQQTYANTFDIAKIYAFYGNPNIPLGDL